MRYHLVLEARPGDFMPIDINLISGNTKFSYQTIEEIDSFTKRFSLKEIMAMIRESNIVPLMYLDGQLQIINDNKYRYPVLFRTTDFSLDTFFAENISNKYLMNKFMNKYYRSINSQKDKMKEALSKKDVSQVLYLLFSLSYLDVRNIYTYLMSIS